MLDLPHARERMVEVQIARRGVRDRHVLEAMRRVPREAFVEPGFEEFAYEDGPLPIGEGQTISQPYVVALMTEALALRGPEQVLEVGTGSGYQTAILAELAAEVVAVERHADLAAGAEGLLRELGGDRFEAFSAGTEATRVRPLAIRAMAELGIDISGQESKTLERYLRESFDRVITVCDDANESCPVFFGAKERLHWSFPDPSKAVGNEEEQLGVYRGVRDAIRERIERELITRA